MSFRALAQTDEDFESWVKKYQDAQNPNLQPMEYDPEKEYQSGTVVSFQDDSTGETLTREYTATKKINKGQAPNLSEAAWKKTHSDDYEVEKNFFLLTVRAMSCY